MPDSWRALERPWPLWLLVCVALDKHAGEGLSIEQCARVVRALSSGHYRRRQSVSVVLAELRAAGLATFRLRRRGKRLPAKLHRLTPRGTARLLQATEDICGAFAHLGVRLA